MNSPTSSTSTDEEVVEPIYTNTIYRGHKLVSPADKLLAFRAQVTNGEIVKSYVGIAVAHSDTEGLDIIGF